MVSFKKESATQDLKKLSKPQLQYLVRKNGGTPGKKTKDQLVAELRTSKGRWKRAAITLFLAFVGGGAVGYYQGNKLLKTIAELKHISFEKGNKLIERIRVNRTKLENAKKSLKKKNNELMQVIELAKKRKFIFAQVHKKNYENYLKELQDLRTDNQTLENGARALREENDTLAKRGNEARSQVQNLTGRLEYLSREYNQILTEKENLEKSSNKAILKLNTTIRGLEENNRKLLARTPVGTSQKARIGQLERENQELKEQIKQHESDIQAAERIRLQNRDELSKRSHEIQRLKDQLGDKVQEIERLNNAAGQDRDRIDDLKRKIAAAKTPVAVKLDQTPQRKTPPRLLPKPGQRPYRSA